MVLVGFISFILRGDWSVARCRVDQRATRGQSQLQSLLTTVSLSAARSKEALSIPCHARWTT